MGALHTDRVLRALLLGRRLCEPHRQTMSVVTFVRLGHIARQVHRDRCRAPLVSTHQPRAMHSASRALLDSTAPRTFRRPVRADGSVCLFMMLIVYFFCSLLFLPQRPLLPERDRVRNAVQMCYWHVQQCDWRQLVIGVSQLSAGSVLRFTRSR